MLLGRYAPLPVRLPVLALALAALLLPGRALAWNDEGHQLVGALAELRLGPEARALVRQVLGGGLLSDREVALWADDTRTRATAPFHWVDIPFESGRYQAARDCPEERCAVAKLTWAEAALAGSGDPAVRLEALRWLVHLVGDLHQPLHAAEGWRHGNLGSVRLKVRAGDPPFDTNFHVVWDAVVVWPVLAGRPPAEAAEALHGTIGAATARGWAAELAPAAWAGASNRLARAIYGELGVTPTRTEPFTVPPGYGPAQRARVEAALGQAGVRLAALLDRIARARLERQARAAAAP